MPFAHHPGPSVVVISNPPLVIPGPRGIPVTPREGQASVFQAELPRLAALYLGLDEAQLTTSRDSQVDPRPVITLGGILPDLTATFTVPGDPRDYADYERGLHMLATHMLSRLRQLRDGVLVTTAYYIVFDDGGYLGFAIDKRGNVTPPVRSLPER